MSAKQFLGVGWKFPLQRDKSGRIALSEYEEKIEESIEVILGTAVGERVMRPDFGCAVHRLLFSPNTSAVHSLAEFHCREALVKWEPRIDVLDITARADRHEPATFNIEISYRVRATNNQFNLVYPFYLKHGAER